jgi:hypothetical protein
MASKRTPAASTVFEAGSKQFEAAQKGIFLGRKEVMLTQQTRKAIRIWTPHEPKVMLIAFNKFPGW